MMERRSLGRAVAVFAVPAVVLSLCRCSSMRAESVPQASSSTPAAPHSKVDEVAKTLETFGSFTIDEWRVGPAFERTTPDGGVQASSPGGDPTLVNFDASGWRTIKLGDLTEIEPCWLRKEIALPSQVFGEPLGGSAKLRLSVSGRSEVWVNGERKGRGDIELTPQAKPGEKFVVAIKVLPPTRQDGTTRSGPIKLSRAELVLEKGQAIRQQLEDLALSLKVAQKLLSFDTYQTSAQHRTDPKTDKSTIDKAEKTRLNELLQKLASEIDTGALAGGALERFGASVAAVREKLGPVREYVQRFTLYFDANAHIDAAWLWRDLETVEVVHNTFSSVLNMMNARPDFTYTQSAAAYYDWVERFYPDVFKGIQQRVKDGRWEVLGGMWVEPDCNLPSGESWARTLLYSKRYFQSKLGVDVKIGWNPDSFGYTWNMPMFYKNAGIEAFVTQKISWNDTNVFPYRVFWWQAPDGSKILTYFPFSYVNRVDNPFALVDWLRQFEANTGFRKLMILFGVGDHGGGPSLQMIDNIERLKKIDLFPRIEYGKTATYLDWLKAQDLSTVPTWEDELYLEYHQGTFTTQAKMKEHNRKTEVLLTNAEKFSALASLAGREYNSSKLERAWRYVLFNQFHDILPGSGIHENYIDATEKFQEVEEIGGFELNESLKRISKDINTGFARAGRPVVVFNALSWPRTDFVTFDLPKGDQGAYAIFDSRGQEIPSQIEQPDVISRSISFVAKEIPPVGYRVFELRKQQPKPQSSKLTISESMIENDLFRVVVDPQSGWVRSITDKRTGKEILAGPGNELQLLEDTPKVWDAWNIDLTGVKYPLRSPKIRIVERGPVRATLRITRDFLKPGVRKGFPTEDFASSFFTQDISLYSGLDWIGFKTDVDWWENFTMLKVAFPVTVSDSKASYEVPFGTIQRSTRVGKSLEDAKSEVPAERWADLSEDGYGVSLLNKTKYGHDIKGSVIRLSLLRSPKWPDPLADRGKHSIEYALFPHRGRVEQSATVQRGYEYNNPLIAVLGEAHKGGRPSSSSFASLTPSSLVLTTIKKAEDGKAWIFQWYNVKAEDSEARLSLPKVPKKVVKSNFVETDGAAVTFKGHEVRVQTPKKSAVTLKVYF